MKKVLKEPYVTCPQKQLNVHVLYLSRRYAEDPDGNQVAVYIYNAKYAAKRALDILLEKDDLMWLHDNKLQSETGIIVEIRPNRHTVATLRELWEHEFTVLELTWEMRSPHSTDCRRFRYAKPRSTLELQAEVTERKEARRGKARASRQGMVPIADIAAACGITAREARAAFRKARIVKPAAGYAFPPSEVDAVKAKLKELLGLV